MHLLLAAAFAITVAGCVVLHGAGDDELTDQFPVRATCTAMVTAIIAYASYFLYPDWRLTLAVAVSTAWAFCWGPQIGWRAKVRRTQAFKGLWLCAGIFPFGLIYGALRPLSYYIGYRKFPLIADEVARGLSGFFLGACVFAAVVYAA